MILSQVVLLPLLLLFTWGYLALRPASRRRTALAFYDAGIIAAAALVSAASVWLVNAWWERPGSTIWPVVMSTVATFHVFPMVLLLGWYVRRLIFTPARL